MTDPLPEATDRFVLEGAVDVAVLVVTYNSAREIDPLLTSLRREAADLRLRVVVVDNASSDATLAVTRRHTDVVSVESGGNLGYAAGINAAIRHAGTARAHLVLNPDLRVRRGTVDRMLAVLDRDTSVGVVAPTVVDDDDIVTTSLFNEPTVFRAACDAVLGPLWRGRPRAFSEWVRRADAYQAPRDVDWASGAALMIRSEVSRIVGEWDERFFLYSEETDFCRRVRDAGFAVRFEPSAVVEHSQGKSGASPELDALLNVSRIRYVRKHAPRSAPLYRRVALLGARLRSRISASHRTTVAILRDERLWDGLPHATRSEGIDIHSSHH